MPFEARHYAIPRNLWTEGIIRYGFHGISCEYIMHRLQQQDPAVNKKKIIIAHLGSGCSLTAVKEGSSIDTTMGFSPAGGLVMNTRAGDIDPGVIIYLQNKKKLKTEQLNILFNKEAGLKAIAQTEHSMEQLLEEAKGDPRAKEAITMFCYHVKKQIGALTAAAGGLDSIVFTGGIGEHAAGIRQLICRELDFMGIQLDEKLNEQQTEIISAGESKVQVYVIPANEEMMIAKHVKEYLLQYH
jgi:acetate kinase